MNRKPRAIAYLASALMLLSACGPSAPTLSLHLTPDNHHTIHVEGSARYILMPIQENQPWRPVRINTGSDADAWMDLRLALDSVDYYVPMELQGDLIEINDLPIEACTWDHLRLTDTLDLTNREYYRPTYHHTPPYGWMNDPNGLVYQNGEYHLQYQYNPYGSTWGNMHWGHAVSPDLIHWQELGTSLERDTMGWIYSGSAVIDTTGSAGFGKGAMVLCYTNHNEHRAPEYWEQQCLAYSLDDGRTFEKYDGNPVLTSMQGGIDSTQMGQRDFRDPKLFWYEPMTRWYMIVSADREMRFYSSPDLRQWQYVSSFGLGWGAQPCQFECPDFFPLPIEQNDKTTKQQSNVSKPQKWVMLVNINPGCPFGGSATEYFVGTFDGKEFHCEQQPSDVHWLDFGKDHYAAVTISNEPKGRIIAIPWMSNWQYANCLPTQQFRSANGLPRELFAFKGPQGETLVGARPVSEASMMTRGERAVTLDQADNLPQNDGALVIDLDATLGSTFTLSNQLGDVVRFSLENGRITMDRTRSGIIPESGFEINDREEEGLRQRNAAPYVNEFALGTWAPLEKICGRPNHHHLQLWLDRSSIELFVDGGKVAMTNLVFPRQPYSSLQGDGISAITAAKLCL